MPVRRIPIGGTSFNYDFQDEPTGIAGGVGNAISTFLKAPLARAQIEQDEDDRAQSNYDRAQRLRIAQQRTDDEHQYRMGLIQERQNDNARKWMATIGTGLKGVLGPLFGMHHGSMTDAQREHLALEIAKARKEKKDFGAQDALNDQDIEDAHYYIDHGVFPHRAPAPAPVVPHAAAPPEGAGLVGALKTVDQYNPANLIPDIDPTGFTDHDAVPAEEDQTFLKHPISQAARFVGDQIFGGGEKSVQRVNQASPVNAGSPVQAAAPAMPATPPAAGAPVAGNDMQSVQIERTLKGLHPNDQAKFKAILASGDPQKIEMAKHKLLTLAAQPAQGDSGDTSE
jgi:hypothetical protein